VVLTVKTPVKKRWFYLAIVLALIVFLGGPLLPLIGSTLRANQSATSVPAATPAARRVADDGSQLEERARGFELVLQREPDNEAALRGLVEIRLQQGSIASALVPLERLAEQHPNQPDYGILLAQAREYLGDYEGAFQAYDTILDTNPGNIDALQGAINLQLKQNRPEGAIGRLQDTLRLAAQANAATPGSIDVASVQLLLGQVYSRQERYVEALAVYDQLIAENPQDFRPVLAKAIVLREQRKVNAARSLFELAASLAPARYKDQIAAMAEELSSAPAEDPSDDRETAVEPTPRRPRPRANSRSAAAEAEPEASETLPAPDSEP